MKESTWILYLLDEPFPAPSSKSISASALMLDMYHTKSDLSLYTVMEWAH